MNWKAIIDDYAKIFQKEFEKYKKSPENIERVKQLEFGKLAGEIITPDMFQPKLFDDSEFFHI